MGLKSDFYVAVILLAKAAGRTTNLSTGARTNRAGRLLPFTRTRQLEVDSAIVIGLGRRGNVEFRERNLFGALRREVPEHRTDDGVVLNLSLVLIAKNKDGSRIDMRPVVAARLRIPRLRPRTAIRKSSIQILVLLAHPLLVEIFRIHLVGHFALSFCVLIIRGVRVVPPIWIVVGVKRISVTVIIPSSVAVATIAVVPETALMQALSVKTLTPGKRSRSRSVMIEARTDVHRPTGAVTDKPGVTAETARAADGSAMAATGYVSATLSTQGH